MEKGEAAASSAPIAPAETTPDTSKPSFLRRHIPEFLAIGACAALGLVAGYTTSDKSNDTRAYPDPVTYIDTAPSREKALQEANEQQHYNGSSVAVVEPSQKSKEYFPSFYTFGKSGPFKDIPELNEEAIIDGKRLFKPELEEYPKIYPFNIYNATEYPLDLRFINYAIRSTRYWINNVMQDGSTINIGGHSLAGVEPRAVPHIMMMLDKTPGFYPDTHAATKVEKDSTVSFILKDDPNDPPYPFEPGHPFRRQGIAIEICQSLVNIEDVRTIPGGLLEQQAVQRNLLNPDARTDLEMAMQEVVCNGLGYTVAAAYDGGYESIRKLADTMKDVGILQRQPLRDLSDYMSQIPEFLRLAQGDKYNPNYFNAAESSGLPTVEWYKRHEASSTYDHASGNLV